MQNQNRILHQINEPKTINQLAGPFKKSSRVKKVLGPNLGL